jgi:preprotein translocase subunit SecA
MERLGLKEGEVIEHPLITRSVERAQRKVEENNFGIRKRLLEYDNVMNQQREVIYRRRRRALVSDRVKDDVLELVEEFAHRLMEKYYHDGNLDSVRDELLAQLGVELVLTRERWRELGPEGVAKEILTAATEFYHRKEEKIGTEIMTAIEKWAVLQVIDEKWKDHLREMDDLKEGIHLRAYGQKDPLIEYKTEGFRMFMELLDQINLETVTLVFRTYPAAAQEMMPVRPVRRPQQMRLTHDSAVGMGLEGNREAVPGSAEEPSAAKAGKQQPIHVDHAPGRNDPCPCGSGKKYKQCHGK